MRTSHEALVQTVEDRNQRITTLQQEIEELRTSRMNTETELADLKWTHQKTVDNEKEQIQNLQSKLDESLNECRAMKNKNEKISYDNAEEVYSLKEKLLKQEENHQAEIQTIEARHQSNIQDLEVRHSYSLAEPNQNHARKLINDNRKLEATVIFLCWLLGSTNVTGRRHLPYIYSRSPF